jgi:hypothetical protein
MSIQRGVEQTGIYQVKSCLLLLYLERNAPLLKFVIVLLVSYEQRNNVYKSLKQAESSLAVSDQLPRVNQNQLLQTACQMAEVGKSIPSNPLPLSRIHYVIPSEAA